MKPTIFSCIYFHIAMYNVKNTISREFVSGEGSFNKSKLVCRCIHFYHIVSIKTLFKSTHSSEV